MTFDADAVDYKGNPADRSTTGGWVSAAQIVGIEICERLSTMAIIVNLVTYLLGTMHLSSSSASNISTNFGGIQFLLCFFGGIIADSFLGRYWTIAIFAGINAIGTCILSISTTLPQLRPPPCNSALSEKCVEANNLQMGVFYFALSLTTLGIGGIKSSVSGLGTDQFDQKDEKEKEQMKTFFDRFYVIISIGTLVAVTVLVYIQDKVGRSWGYGICSAMMVLALITFLLGTRRYRYKKRVGSPVVQILQVLVAAIRKRNVEFPSSTSPMYEDSTQETKISHTNKYSCLDKAAVITSEDYGSNGMGTPNPWRLCTVTRVEEVKMLGGLIPIWATTPMFWTVYGQMSSFSVQQASTMERSIGKFQIPPGSYYVFFIGSIMLTLTTYDQLVMRLRKSKKQGLTNLQKIGIGHFFSIIGMVAAGLVEMKRLSIVSSTRGTTVTLPISAFWLLPQFILVGIGNGFIYSGQLDFFITQSPKRMKAIGTGLFLATISLGFFVSSILVTIIRNVTGSNGGQNWLPRSINDGKLDYFYWLLAVLSFINSGFYLVCAKRYKPNPGENAEEANGEANGDVPLKEINEV